MPKPEPFLVVSYYTKRTAYADHAKRLSESALEYRIPTLIEAVPNMKSWYKNTHYKPEFILQALKENGDLNIVWVDVDAVFHAYPELFEVITKDFACHFRNWRHNPHELLSGTLFFRNNRRARDLLREWSLMNRKNPRKWDQKNLERALRRCPQVRTHKLPLAYCYIFDDVHDKKKVKPIIEHFQASRKLRHEVER